VESSGVAVASPTTVPARRDHSPTYHESGRLV
jgi:hypothetical protein